MHRTPRRKEIERKQQLDVERWLKDKFREGFYSMRKKFEEKDTEKNGIVSTDTDSVSFILAQRELHNN